jgi:hypothetical protein
MQLYAENPVRNLEKLSQHLPPAFAEDLPTARANFTIKSRVIANP